MHFRIWILSLFAFIFFTYFLFDQFVFSNSFSPPLNPFYNLGWKAWVTLLIFCMMFAALVKEIRPPDVILFVTTSILVILGILPPEQFLQGFANEMIMTIAMLFIVVRTMEVNGLLEIIASKLLSKSKSYYRQMLSLILPIAAISVFVYHTPFVLLMTPVIRKWALDNKLYPSKFLIPLSFSAILGGACSLTGTSTNIIVQGLLKLHDPGASLGFFELGYVGLPCAIVGLIYILFGGKRWLPEHKDPSTVISEQIPDLTAEFMIKEDCPLMNKMIKDVSGKFFRKEMLIQIERDNHKIDSPPMDLILRKNDRLVFLGDINQIAEVHAIPGLQSMADPHFKLDVTSSHFSEIIIPENSLLIGKTLRQINFRTNYGASVLAVYREGKRLEGSVRDIILHAGDILMLLSGEPWPLEVNNFSYNKDFYYIKPHEKLRVFNIWSASLVIFAFGFIIVGQTFGFSLMVLSLAAVLLLLFTRSISIREVRKSFNGSLLLLIACSFALGRAIETTGIAHYLAELIYGIVGNNPYMLIGGILFVTLVATELLSHSATPLIFFPIAVHVINLAGYENIASIKAVGVAIAIGTTYCFTLPTGYQINMIIYGPGSYRFQDFIKFGLPLDIMLWIVATLLIPILWPLTH